MAYDSEYIARISKHVAKQLNRESVTSTLVNSILRIAEGNPSVDGFIAACRTFGTFDQDFLRDLYFQRPQENHSEIVKVEKEEQKIKQQVTEVPIPKKALFKRKVKPVLKYDDDEVFVPSKQEISDARKDMSEVKVEDEQVRRIEVEDKDVKKIKVEDDQVTKIKVEDDQIQTSMKPGDNGIIKIRKSVASSTKRLRDGDLSSLSESARDKLTRIRQDRQNRQDSNGSLTGESQRRQSRSPPEKQHRSSHEHGRKSDYGRNSPFSYSSGRNQDLRPRSLDQVDASYDPASERFLDREWYTSEEFNGAAGDAEHNPFYDNSYDEEGEKQMEAKLRTRITARAAQRKRENDQWEQNRMRTGGVLSNTQYNADFDNEEKSQVHVFIHHTTPPFLDGKQVFTRLKEPVSAVKDPQSNLAVFARKGSFLVKERRKQRERQKQAKQAASMAGTVLGDVLGVQDGESSDTAVVSKDKVASDSRNSANSNFSRTKSLKEQRQFLPAFAVRDQLLNVIRDNQVVVVIGETGSGKTTQLTQFLYEEGYGTRGMIGCTQPRRVAAMSVARRVAEEMNVKLGDEVGYAIRFEDHTSSKTKIKYMTEGILLRESLEDPRLEKYSCIIMDEAHERAVNTDVLMGLFKNILVKRRDIKLIVTSATLNADRFSRFYGGTPQFTIPGRTFPVEVLNSQAPVEDYVDAAVKQVLSIHLQNGPGDILVFMTGQEDIDATCGVLKEKLLLLDKPEPLEILPIYSQMPADLQAKIFEPAAKGTRKVIVATNIAETSLTVDGISFVVDTGYAKLKVYNPKMGMDSLQMVPISRANSNQRSGRAGRTGKGIAYRLYTERSEREEMYEQTIPEIQRTNLSNTLLLLKSLGVSDLLQFHFMDPPPSETITASLYDLWALGALDNLGQLTEIGSQMASFPMDPSLSKLLIMSVQYRCVEEMLTIVAMLSVPTVFYRPKERQEESDAAREKFFVPESDHLTLLHVYNMWRNNGYSDSWSVKHFLHARTLSRAREVRDQLLTILEGSKKIQITSCKGDWDVIRKCICSGYFHQAAKVKGLTDYVNIRTSVTMQLHATSALYGLGYLPEYVVYHELVLTSKQYLSCVTAVDPYWLSEFGGVFYSVQERNGDGQMMKKDNNHEAVEDSIERDRVKYQQMMEEKQAGKGRVKTLKSAVVLPGSRNGRKSRGW